MDVLDKLPEESNEMVETLVKLMGLLITSYPVVSPLLEQLKDNIKDALAAASDVLPRVTQALNEIEIDEEVTEKFASELFDAVPEIKRLFQKAKE